MNLKLYRKDYHYYGWMQQFSIHECNYWIQPFSIDFQTWSPNVLQIFNNMTIWYMKASKKPSDTSPYKNTGNKKTHKNKNNCSKHMKPWPVFHEWLQSSFTSRQLRWDNRYWVNHLEVQFEAATHLLCSMFTLFTQQLWALKTIRRYSTIWTYTALNINASTNQE